MLHIYKHSLRNVEKKSISLSSKAEGFNSARRFPSPAAVFYTILYYNCGTFILLELNMLQKLYLVSSKSFKKLAAPKKPPSKIKRKLPQSDFDKWIKLSGKLQEEDATLKAPIKDIAKFVKQVPPEPPVQRFERITPAVKRWETLPTVVAEINRNN